MMLCVAVHGSVHGVRAGMLSKCFMNARSS
jgi:hypothetical protein